MYQGVYMPKGKRRGVEKVTLRQEDVDAARKEFRPLALGARVINALVAGGILSINDLYTLSVGEIEQVPGIGPKTVEALKAYLRGQRFPMDRSAHLMSIKFPESALAAIDQWALQQKGVVSRAEAIRRLVELGLLHQPDHKKN
jgi:hypothetical protein